ncbi:unnamed protein product [Arctogadus glacialis]
MQDSTVIGERGDGETLVLGRSRSGHCGGLIHNTSCPTAPSHQYVFDSCEGTTRRKLASSPRLRDNVDMLERSNTTPVQYSITPPLAACGADEATYPWI